MTETNTWETPFSSQGWALFSMCWWLHNLVPTRATTGGAHRLRPPATACDCLRLLKKIFVHVYYRWHNPYTHSPNPSNPPGLPPSVPTSVPCINSLKERHITIVSCTK